MSDNDKRKKRTEDLRRGRSRGNPVDVDDPQAQHQRSGQDDAAGSTLVAVLGNISSVRPPIDTGVVGGRTNSALVSDQVEQTVRSAANGLLREIEQPLPQVLEKHVGKMQANLLGVPL